MNILLYVMTMLMLLSSITYVALERYRSSASLNATIVFSMQNQEREPMIKLSQSMYDRITFSKPPPPPKEKDAEEKPRETNPASPRLSLYILLDKETRTKEPEAYQQIRELAKHLMTSLYSHTAFYKEINATRPSFLNDILDELVEASDNPQNDLSIKTAAHLSKLQLASPELHEVFIHMLKGVPKLIQPIEVPEKQFVVEEDTPEPNAEDEIEASRESQEASSDPGYASLQDYLSTTITTKVRIFLASRALLTAIYGDPFVVNEIIQKRKELYRQVLSGGDKKNASAEFEALFANAGQASAYKNILDFGVSKTNPAKYEK